jgi:hypothetical protein
MTGQRMKSVPVMLGVDAIGAEGAVSRGQTPDANSQTAECDTCAARKQHVKSAKKHLNRPETKLE